jgi:hypothetical protein
MENSENQVTEKSMAKNAHGGRRLGAGRPRKFALSSAPVAWLAELSRLCGPDTKRVTTSEGFADVILNLLRELHAVGSRPDEIAELIQADAADPDVQRRRKIAVLQAVTLQIRSAILLQLVTAAAAVQKATGKKFPWDGSP